MAECLKLYVWNPNCYFIWCNSNSHSSGSNSCSSKETDSEVGHMKSIVGITAQGMCLLAPVQESMLKYLELKVTDLFSLKDEK